MNSKDLRTCVHCNDLPVEIWVIIFQYFDIATLQKNLSLVCRHWLEIIRNNQKMSGNLTLTFCSGIIEFYPLDFHGPPSRFVQSENAKCVNQDKTKLSEILENWPKLRSLTIKRRNLFQLSESLDEHMYILKKCHCK